MLFLFSRLIMEVIHNRKSQYLGRKRINVIFRGKRNACLAETFRASTLLIVLLERAKS